MEPRALRGRAGHPAHRGPPGAWVMRAGRRARRTYPDQGLHYRGGFPRKAQRPGGTPPRVAPAPADLPLNWRDGVPPRSEARPTRPNGVEQGTPFSPPYASAPPPSPAPPPGTRKRGAEPEVPG